jgi:hypothetical protein
MRLRQQTNKNVITADAMPRLCSSTLGGCGRGLRVFHSWASGSRLVVATIRRQAIRSGPISMDWMVIRVFARLSTDWGPHAAIGSKIRIQHNPGFVVPETWHFSFLAFDEILTFVRTLPGVLNWCRWLACRQKHDHDKQQNGVLK